MGSIITRLFVEIEAQAASDSDLVSPANVEALSSDAPPPVHTATDIDTDLSRAVVSKLAPDFSLPAVVDGEFKNVKLSDYSGKYVVLFFWPRDFTFVCPTEIIAFSDQADEFRQIGCEILGCSTDSQYSHLAWIQKPRNVGGLGDTNIPLLSDSTHRIARDYGVLEKSEGVALSGSFIIDVKGVLRQITINDMTVGRDVDETLRLVRAFQYADANGEVCPAGWRPGKAAIKPGVKESKEFFDKANS